MREAARGSRVRFEDAVAAYHRADLAEAEQLCRAVIGSATELFNANHLLAVVLCRRGEVEEALANYDAALSIQPDAVQALVNRGAALRRLRRHDEALSDYDQALSLQPDDADLWLERGDLLETLGRYDDALASYDKALALRPEQPRTLCRRGGLLFGLRRYEEALASFDRALAMRPVFPEALHNRGGALYRLKRYEEALESYDRALALRPGYAEALAERGLTRQALGRFEGALADCGEALRLQPDYPNALCIRGNALQGLQRHEEALASYDEALRLRPDDPEALSNRGNALQQLRRYDEALASYDKALLLRPDYAEGHHNRSVALLRRGSFAAGWAEYEWRRKTGAWTERRFAAPKWRGEKLSGRRLLLHAEQGFGDTIQFARFAPLLAARGAAVVLEVQRPLKALMQSIGGVTAVVAVGEAPSDADFQSSLLSVPLHLGLDEAQIPAQVPYLAPDADRIAAWSRRLPRGDFTIGIAWQGNPAVAIDQGRSIPLRAFAPLCEIPGIRLISLQKHHGLEQTPPAGMSVDILPDFDTGADAFLDTAAVMMSLDLIITSDTAVAHLAGALGRPVWILLQAVPDWRWMVGRDDTPWYPTARLFRQHRPGDWDEVMTRVADAGAAAVARTARIATDDTAAAMRQALGLYEQGELDEAERLGRMVVGADESHSGAHHLLAVIQSRRGRHLEALAAYDRTLAIHPGDAQVLSNRGHTLNALERYEEALMCLDQALAIQPDLVGALSHQGNAFYRLNRIEEALASYDKVLSLQPDFPDALNNRGNALCFLRRFDEALASYDKALSIQPDFGFCRFNRSWPLLLLGRFAEGWRDYEWRDKTETKNFDGPKWRGEDVHGKRIGLYSDGPLGDTIMFARFAPFVAALGAQVVLSARRPLAALLRSLAGVDAVFTEGQTPPEVDFQLALQSVPFTLGLDQARIPAAVPYLSADPARVTDWARRLPEGSPRIGIVWQGDPHRKIDRGRSIPLRAFAPLAEVSGVRLISLQKHHGLEQLAQLPAGMRVHDLGEAFDAGPDAFLDAAAVMMHLDLIVTVDTAIGNLAGALGRPVWVLLPEVPDWRWMLDREHSPWYPTARLFRQRRRDDWDDVMTRVAAALRA